MSNYPLAPPPSYDELPEKSVQISEPTMGFQTSPSSPAQYNYGQVEVNLHNTQFQQPPVQIQPLPQQQLLVIQGAPMVLGPHATRFICPGCQKNILTRIEYKSNSTTHFIAAALCLMGCFPLMVIPYCLKTCKNREHYCTECDNYLGTYSSGGYRGFR